MNIPTPKGYLPREIEGALLSRVKTFPAVALTGPRQTGKSTLLRQLLPDYSYVTLDDPLIRQQARDDPEMLLSRLKARAVIDEIQYAPDLLPYIKIRIDNNRTAKGQFVVTGSQQFVLIRNLSESLAGRIGLLELLPLSVTELPADDQNVVEAFKNACLRGMYPEPALTPDLSPDAWYASYLQTYLERDIRSIYDIGSLLEFDSLLRLLASRCAQPLNLSSLSTDIGASVNTIKRWISILEASRIIYLLPPYYKNLGKRITKSPKVYFTDCGLVCHLTRLSDFDQLLQGPMAGPLFENFCIQEAIKAVINLGSLPRLYYLRTSSGLEVDLLIEGRNGALTPFELKSSQTPRQNMATNLDKFSHVFAELGSTSGHVVSLSMRQDPLTRFASLLPFTDFLQFVRSTS